MYHTANTAPTAQATFQEIGFDLLDRLEQTATQLSEYADDTEKRFSENAQ